MSGVPARGVAGVRAWFATWSPLLPVLVAEFIILLGFGALLPVLPLYVQEQGVDGTTLGLIIAGWPIAKLVSEPVFGWLADRTLRKPQMIVGLVVLAVSTMLPVVLTSAPALFLLRLAGGLGAGMYDPAARGLIVDATHEDRRGEAFGIYTAFQMGGFIVGPAIGALGASLGGGFTFPFILTGILTFAAMLLLVVSMPGQARVAGSTGLDAVEPGGAFGPAAGTPPGLAAGSASGPAGGPPSARAGGAPTARPAEAAPARPGEAAPARPGEAAPPRPGEAAPSRRGQVTAARPDQAPLAQLANRMLVAALVLNFGFQLAFGTYEVVWSLFMTNLGASIEWVAATFILFAVPGLILSPLAGRLVDRRGPFRYVIGGGSAIILAGAAYAVSVEPVFPSLVVPVEAVAQSFLTPAIYAMAALGTPMGRSATAQGLLGATGTIALITSSVAAGALWDMGASWPFWFFVVGSTACLVLGLLIHRGARSMQVAGVQAPVGAPGVRVGPEGAAGG
jgi:MFS family permease